MTKTQRAKIVKELNDIISLRNHIYILVNGPRTRLISKEEENDLRKFANNLDREVVDLSLEISKSSVELNPIVTNTTTMAKKANAVKAKEEEVKELGGKVTDETIKELDDKAIGETIKEENPKKIGSFRRVTEQI